LLPWQASSVASSDSSSTIQRLIAIALKQDYETKICQSWYNASTTVQSHHKQNPVKPFCWKYIKIGGKIQKDTLLAKYEKGYKNIFKKPLETYKKNLRKICIKRNLDKSISKIQKSPQQKYKNKSQTQPQTCEYKAFSNYCMFNLLILLSKIQIN